VGIVSRAAACAAGALILASCAGDRVAGPEYPEPSPPVQDFIHSQGLPLLRASERLFCLDGVEVFRVKYGQPHDCPSGCFYSSAHGVRSETRVGWLVFNDVDSFEPDTSRFFDVTPADSALCRADLWDRMQADEPSRQWFWSALLPIIARDADTDPQALVRISRLLYSYISPHVAWRLLENPYVQHDVPILTNLARLPVFRGDAYELIRARATELLNGLGIDDTTVEP